MNKLFSATLFCACSAASLASADMISAGSVVGVIDYNDSGSGHNFVNALHASDGQIIWLDMTLVAPTDETGFGFQIETVKAGEIDYRSEEAAATPVTCDAESNSGLAANFDSLYRISFGNSDDYHAPSELIVGDRASYPLQKLSCEVDRSGDVTVAKLHVRGHFSVAIADIPTAIEMALYPATAGNE